MKRCFARTLILLFVSLGCLSTGVSATPVPLAEIEANDTAGTAQVLSPGDFTDVSTLAGKLAAFDGQVFNSTSMPHVSIDGALSSPADVDFYRFAVTAPSTGIFDIDRGFGGSQAVDLSLALFDDLGRVLAWATGACDGACIGPVALDAGSTDYRDPLIGVYDFTQAGSYTVAVMADGVTPDAFGTFGGTLERPDFEYGGNAYLPDAGPAALVGTPTPVSGGDYRLQVSLSSPAAVPAPPVLTLVVGLLALSLAVGRWSGRLAGGRQPTS